MSLKKELISNAYKGFSKQTGENLEDDMYKQKYLKYKLKYLQYKAQKGGIINEKSVNPCEKGKTNPVFAFGTNKINKIVKYTPTFGKTSAESFYKFIVGTNCDIEDPIALHNLLIKLNFQQIYFALVELLNDYYQDKNKIKHFNQLLLSLIIMYLTNIKKHSELVTISISLTLVTLNKIKKIIDLKTGWCVNEKLKLKCGDKYVSENLDTLLNEAFLFFQSILLLQNKENPFGILTIGVSDDALLFFLKNMLSNLKDDEVSLNLFNKLNIISPFDNIACLCAEIIIGHYKIYNNYNIPLLLILLKIEASDTDEKTAGRQNNLLAKICSTILGVIDDKLKNLIINVFKKNGKKMKIYTKEKEDIIVDVLLKRERLNAQATINDQLARQAQLAEQKNTIMINIAAAAKEATTARIVVPTDAYFTAAFAAAKKPNNAGIVVPLEKAISPAIAATVPLIALNIKTLVEQFVIDILDVIDKNYVLLPQILQFIYKKYNEYNNNPMFQNRYYYNTLFLRYISPFISSIYPNDKNFILLIGRVLQKLNAFLKDRVTEIADNIYLLFDYEVFMPYINKIYGKKNILLNSDKFDTSKALNCTFPNVATLFLPKKPIKE